MLLRRFPNLIKRFPFYRFIKIKEYPITMEPAEKTPENTIFGVPKDLSKKYECKSAFGNQLRLQYVLKYPEEFFDNVGIVAGWSKTCR